MTRELAINILSTRDNQGMPITWQNGFIEAYDMAIEALEREGKKCGEWIQHVNEPSLWSCSICETVIYSEHEEDRLKFHKWCGCCGADMKGGSNDGR